MAESHYPECDLFDPICTGNIGGHIPRWMVGHACVACKKPCICPALRACEARVRAQVAFSANVREAAEGWANGVQAAREAVAAEAKARHVDGPTMFLTLPQALAAIDGVLEDK